MLIPSYVHILTLQKPHITAGFNMCLVISKCVTAVKVSNFSGQYLCNHWTLDIGVLGYIGIVWPKKHPPEVLHIPPGTACIFRSRQQNHNVKIGSKCLESVANARYLWTTLVNQYCVEAKFKTRLNSRYAHYCSVQNVLSCPSIEELENSYTCIQDCYFYCCLIYMLNLASHM